MKKNRTRSARNRRGLACAIALGILMILGLLAASFASGIGLNLRAGANQRSVLDARLAAESGVAFMLFQFQELRLPGNTTQEELPNVIATSLGSWLNGTGNLAGQVVSVSDGAVIVPPIQIGDGSFTARITVPGEDICRLEVTGTTGGVSRRLGIDMQLRAANSLVFQSGLASKGSVTVQGNAQIVGVDDPSEASILAASLTGGIAVGGNAVISGELFTSGDPSDVVITGNPTIAGHDDIEGIMENIHTGLKPPLFPEPDTAPLAPLATTVVDADTVINQNGLVFDNIRIAAGTDPNFSHDVVLNGIVVIEAPNHVKFDGKVTVNGMIITLGAGENPIADCRIRFAGQVEANGVEALPDEPQFADVKQQTGTFILAPGFDVAFAGQFTTIAGTIAADQLSFSGQAEGTVTGSVVGLADLPTVVDGNVSIRVKQAATDYNPAGFVKCLALTPEAVSYTELVGQ